MRGRQDRKHGLNCASRGANVSLSAGESTGVHSSFGVLIRLPSAAERAREGKP